MKKELKLKDVDFEVLCFPEDMALEGNCIASDNEEYDKKVENDLREQLENGNEWAWCRVEVIGTYKSLTATEHLGGCSYKSEAQFKRDGYYKDMKNQVLQELNEKLNELFND
jgi:hypothetical protein